MCHSSCLIFVKIILVVVIKKGISACSLSLLILVNNSIYLKYCYFQERVNLEFETMFETGVDEMSWDDTVRSILKVTATAFHSV